MNLGDLLDELRHGILHDFSDQVGGTPDQLWSDARLTRYINEAERRMARSALLIRDNQTPEATQLQTRAFIKEYDLHPSVLAVLSVRCAGDTADLARAGHTAFDTYHVPDTYFFDPSSLSAMPPGKILAYSTDEGFSQNDEGNASVVVFRTFPAPDSIHTGIISLRVIRLPLNRLEDLTDTPEIPEVHHMDMLDWAAYLALRIVDLDAGAADRAKEFRESFELRVKEARDVSMRKLFTPLQWGFGRGGYSWVTN